MIPEAVLAKLTTENAIQIEREMNLESGDIACDREMTRAEEIYLGVPRTPLLAIHLQGSQAYPSLLLYEQEIGASTKPYSEGFFFANYEDANQDVKNQWAGLVMVRMQGQLPILGQRFAATFTGWDPVQPELSWSMSVDPRTISNVFYAAPVPMLLAPQLADMPPEYPGGRSPGRCIQRLGVYEVRWIYSILYQGTTTLKHIDGHKLRAMAKDKADEEEATRLGQ